MELKTRYQYSYFIHPYIIDENKYDKYLLKLLKDKHCKLKTFEREKDLNIYTYFLPNIRDYLFWTFNYSREKLNNFNKIEDSMKAAILSKYNCNMFEYTLGNDVQGKVGEKNGIFFDIQKIEIICFSTGVCFILLKTIVEEENKFSDILNFNYKFRDINSEFVSLKDYENIRLQTSSLKDIKDLCTVIKNITGPNKDAKSMNLDDERFLTYSYTCIDQENWNDKIDFSNIQGEFTKYSNILPNNYQVNFDMKMNENQIFQSLKYAKMGMTKQGTVLLASNINTENYTKLPFKYEQEYLYTYILALYKKIYIKKMNLEFSRTNKFQKTRNQLMEFTRTIWIQEVTNDFEGSSLYEKWSETLELDRLYFEIKNKYDIVYKDLNIGKSRKINYAIITVLIATLGFNIVNFIMLYLKK